MESHVSILSGNPIFFCPTLATLRILPFPYVPLMKPFFIIRERQYGLLLQCFKAVFYLAKGKVLINMPILSGRDLLT